MTGKKFSDEDSVDTPFYFGHEGVTYGLSVWQHRLGDMGWYLALCRWDTNTLWFISEVENRMPSEFDQQVADGFITEVNAYLENVGAPPPDLRPVAMQYWRALHNHRYIDGQLVPKDVE